VAHGHKVDRTGRPNLHDDVLSLRAVYVGEQNATIGMFKDRFVAGALLSSSTTLTSGLEVSDRNILVENELKPLVDERIEAVPTAFEYKASEETPEAVKLAEETNEWAAGRVTPDGHDLVSLFQVMTEDQEKDGRTAVSMGTVEKDGETKVWAEARDAARIMPLYGEPDNPALVTGWELRWTRKASGSQPAAEFVEVVTAQTRTLKSGGKSIEEEEHGLGFIPMVVVPRNIVKGSPIGSSGIGELIQGYLNFLWATYMRNVANKYAAFPVWVPMDEITAMALAGDEDGRGATQIEVTPGAVLIYRLEPKGGSVDFSSLEKQRSDSLECLRRQGRGEQDQAARADMRSGKAKVIGRRGMDRYAGRKLTLLKVGLEMLATIRWWLLNPKMVGTEAPLIVEMADQLDTDPEEQRERGKMWIEMFKVGLAKVIHVLRQFQRLALIDEDVDVAEMAAEIEAMDEEKATTRMEQMAAIVNRDQENNNSEEGGNPPPPGANGEERRANGDGRPRQT